jgi:hypothetical protein
VAQEIVDELHKLLENPDYDSYLNSRLVEESTEREEKVCFKKLLSSNLTVVIFCQTCPNF